MYIGLRYLDMLNKLTRLHGYKMNHQEFITLFALNKVSTFSIKGSKEIVNENILEIFSCFDYSIDVESHKITFSLLQKNTEKLRSKINNYVVKHRGGMPIINKLNDYFKNLDEDEFFYIFPYVEKISQEQHLMTSNELLCHMNEGLEFESLQRRFSEVCGDVIANYVIDGVSSDKKIMVGEGLKKNRFCRFCHKKNGEITFNGETTFKTTFKEEAHAISESLGNKTIILNEECDICNTKFSRTIEKDIDTYLKVLSSFFKIKNKERKVSKIKGKNFELSYVKENESVTTTQVLEKDKEDVLKPDFVLIHIPKKNQERNNEGIPTIIPLEFNEKVNMQNIYKALVKFSLSVIDRKHLSNFDKTIEWLSSDEFYSSLPKVAVLHSYESFSKQPYLLVYLRKGNDTNLPLAVAEFQFTFLKFVFLIPSFVEEECDFTSDEDYQRFWAFFKQYNLQKNWKFQNFSSSESKEFVFNMVMGE